MLLFIAIFFVNPSIYPLSTSTTTTFPFLLPAQPFFLSSCSSIYVRRSQISNGRMGVEKVDIVFIYVDNSFLIISMLLSTFNRLWIYIRKSNESTFYLLKFHIQFITILIYLLSYFIYRCFVQLFNH